jgi:hypothetical protein
MSEGVSRHFDLISKSKNPIKFKYGVAVRMFQTEPNSKKLGNFADGYEIAWKESIEEQIYLYCIRKDKEGTGEDRIISVGYDKDVGTATGYGDTPEKAINVAYNAIEGIAMTGLLYRPKFDFISKDYFTSIMNRYEFLMDSGLI